MRMISCKEILILFLLVIVLSRNINGGIIIPLILSQDADDLNNDPVSFNPRGIHRFNGLYRLTKTIKRSQNIPPTVVYSEGAEKPDNDPDYFIHRDKTSRSLYRILSRMHTRVQKRSQKAMQDDIPQNFETPEVLKYLGGFGLGKLRIINAENDELDHEACNKRDPEELSSPGSAADSFKQSNYMFRITK